MGTDKSCGPPSLVGLLKLLKPFGGSWLSPWPWGGRWSGGPQKFLGPGGPCSGALEGGDLAGGALPGSPWPEGPLGRGPLARGAKKIREEPKIRKLSNQPAWTPGQPPGPGIQLPGTRAPPGGGGPTNPEPKTLNRPPEAKGYDLGLYFSYAKGGLGAGHPLAEY